MDFKINDGKSLALGKIQSHKAKTLQGQMALGKSKGHLL